MTVDREELRDWHRLFGLLPTDFFTGSPFTVEIDATSHSHSRWVSEAVLISSVRLIRVSCWDT
jgi:hypothetical protein